MPKKLMTCLIVLGLLCTMVFAVTGVSAEPIKLKYWFLWTGKEADQQLEAVKRFNAMQKEIVVEGLSVPDNQKQLVGLASDDGPDITDLFDSSIGNFAEKGLIMPLDDLAMKNGFDFAKNLSPASVEAVTYKGKIWGYPLGLNLMMMWYNKDHLKAAGIKTPPKTYSELLAAAIKCTKYDSKGEIVQIGFPVHPRVYYMGNFAVGAGVTLNAPDKLPVVGDRGWYQAAKLWVDYCNKVGFDKVKRFVGAYSGYLNASDPFLLGMQTFRVDGAWLPSFAKDFAPNMNYGVVPIPYLDGKTQFKNPTLAGFSTMHIAAKCKHPEAAWKFLSYISSAKQQILMAYANQSVYLPPHKVWPNKMKEFQEMQKNPVFSMFIESGKNSNIRNYPNEPWVAELQQTCDKKLEAALDGAMSLDEAWKDYVAAQQKVRDKVIAKVKR